MIRSLVVSGARLIFQMRHIYHIQKRSYRDMQPKFVTAKLFACKLVYYFAGWDNASTIRHKLIVMGRRDDIVFGISE